MKAKTIGKLVCRKYGGIEEGPMCDKGLDKNYEQWSFLEKFKGYNIEFNREILNAAEEQGVDVHKVFGKAISNILKNGKETRNILQYAVDCFSIGRTSYSEDVQLFGTEELVGRWCKAYLVELGGDFWQIKFAFSVGAEHGESIVNYSKGKVDKSEIQYDKDTGEVLGWIKPMVGQMIDMKQLRGV